LHTGSWIISIRREIALSRTGATTTGCDLLAVMDIEDLPRRRGSGARSRHIGHLDSSQSLN